MLLLVLRPTPEWTDRLFDQILSILNRFWLQFCRCAVDFLSIFYLTACGDNRATAYVYTYTACMFMCFLRWLQQKAKFKKIDSISLLKYTI